MKVWEKTGLHRTELSPTATEEVFAWTRIRTNVLKSIYLPFENIQNVCAKKGVLTRCQKKNARGKEVNQQISMKKTKVVPSQTKQAKASPNKEAKKRTYIKRSNDDFTQTKQGKDALSKEAKKDFPLQDYYSKIYEKYDLVNRVFTFGQDVKWRKKAVEECLQNKPAKFLDICTGTGDLVIDVARTAGREIELHGYDFSAEMLQKAKEKAAEIETGNGTGRKAGEKAANGSGTRVGKEAGKATNKEAGKAAGQEAGEAAGNETGEAAGQEAGEAAGNETGEAAGKVPAIKFTEGNVAAMPYADGTFDSAGITFGIRNLVYENSNADRHLEEIRRILRDYGRLVILESSKPDNRIWRFFNNMYLQLILPWLGGIISGNLKAYRYLARSSKNYYSRKEMSDILEKAGFITIRSKGLFLGSVMLLVAEKQVT